MVDFSKDKITNIINQGIKQGIRVTFDNHCYGSCVILIYSAIDAMAFLSMPQGRNRVQRDDFVNWCDRYMKFNCDHSPSGLELYSARCAMLHTYGVKSGLTQNNRARMVGYMDLSVPAVRFDASVSKELVIVSIHALREVLFVGIDQFLIDVFSDQSRVPVFEKRLDELAMVFPT